MNTSDVVNGASSAPTTTPSKATAKMVSLPAAGDNPALALGDYEALYGIPTTTIHAWIKRGQLSAEQDATGHRKQRVRWQSMQAFLETEQAGTHRGKHPVPKATIANGTKVPQEAAAPTPTTTPATASNSASGKHNHTPPARACPAPVPEQESAAPTPAPTAYPPPDVTPPAPVIGGEAGAVEKTVPLHTIVFEDKTQVREKLNLIEVGHYADLMRQGTQFPPVELFSDGKGRYYVGDGHHRLKAAALAGRHEFHARIHPGGLEAARHFALGANRQHGLRYTNKDKLRAIALALELHPEWSNVQIAEHCAVSEANVRKHRVRFVKNDPGLRVGADGKTYTTKKTAESNGAKTARHAMQQAKYWLRQMTPDLRAQLFQWFEKRFARPQAVTTPST